MESVYKLCELLIQKNRPGTQEKMDTYLAADRLTTDEYTELMRLLQAT